MLAGPCHSPRALGSDMSIRRVCVSVCVCVCVSVCLNLGQNRGSGCPPPLDPRLINVGFWLNLQIESTLIQRWGGGWGVPMSHVDYKEW